MAGRGTGVPLTFRCRVCRGMANEVTLTGRRRAEPPGNLNRPRLSNFHHEYRCSCGHVGWSRHGQVEQYGKQPPKARGEQP